MNSEQLGALARACALHYRVAAAELVRGIDLDLLPGRFVGIVGPNGAGKTTLLRLLNGLLPPSAGAVYITGRPVGELTPEDLARRMALVPQHHPVDLDFTVLDMVVMGRYARDPRRWTDDPSDRGAALAAMARTGVAHLAQRPFRSLSGGERQRVIIARALAQEPRLLLLDEPTASLDLRHQLEILSLVRDITASGVGAVAALHDLSLAVRYCHHLVLLDRGAVAAAGPPEHVLTPERLQAVFGVQALVERHPVLGHLVVLPVAVSADDEGR